MKALRNTIFASLGLGFLLLAGCSGDKHIAEVKAMPFSYPSDNVQDPNMTVDQALDYRKICDSVKWTSSLTEQHQVVIEYRCSYKGVKDSAIIAVAKAHSPSTSSIPDMVGDIYQWTYGADGKPQLNYVAMQVHFENGKAWDITHSNTINGIYFDGVAWETALMKMAVDNTAEDYDHLQSQLYGTPIPQKPEAPHPIHETASLPSSANDETSADASANGTPPAESASAPQGLEQASVPEAGSAAALAEQKAAPSSQSSTATHADGPTLSAADTSHAATRAGNPSASQIVIFQFDGPNGAEPAYCADEGADGVMCRSDSLTEIGQGTFKDYMIPGSKTCIAGTQGCVVPKSFDAAHIKG